MLERDVMFNPSDMKWYIISRRLNPETGEPQSGWQLYPGSYNSKRAAETGIGIIGGPLKQVGYTSGLWQE